MRPTRCALNPIPRSLRRCRSPAGTDPQPDGPQALRDRPRPIPRSPPTTCFNPIPVQNSLQRRPRLQPTPARAAACDGPRFPLPAGCPTRTAPPPPLPLLTGAGRLFTLRGGASCTPMANQARSGKATGCYWTGGLSSAGRDGGAARSGMSGPAEVWLLLLTLLAAPSQPGEG